MSLKSCSLEVFRLAFLQQGTEVELKSHSCDQYHIIEYVKELKKIFQILLSL